MRHDRHVVKALLSAAFFLAQSEDDAITGDHAIFELDAIAANLQEMDEIARYAFVQMLDDLARDERNPKIAEFIRGFAADNGLVDESGS